MIESSRLQLDQGVIPDGLSHASSSKVWYVEKKGFGQHTQGLLLLQYRSHRTPPFFLIISYTGSILVIAEVTDAGCEYRLPD